MGPTGVNRTCVTCCPKPNGAQRCGQSCNHTYPGRMPGTLLSQTAGCWEPLCPWFETLCPPQTFLWQIYFSAMKMCNLTRALCRHQSRVAIHAWSGFRGLCSIFSQDNDKEDGRVAHKGRSAFSNAAWQQHAVPVVAHIHFYLIRLYNDENVVNTNSQNQKRHHLNHNQWPLKMRNAKNFSTVQQWTFAILGKLAFLSQVTVVSAFFKYFLAYCFQLCSFRILQIFVHCGEKTFLKLCSSLFRLLGRGHSKQSDSADTITILVASFYFCLCVEITWQLHVAEETHRRSHRQ